MNGLSSSNRRVLTRHRSAPERRAEAGPPTPPGLGWNRGWVLDDQDQAIAIIGEHIEALRALGVASLVLFGSVARGEAAESSDIDPLVEFSRPVGLFDFLEVKEYLESVLGREVDRVPRDSLKPRIRDEVLAEAVDAA